VILYPAIDILGGCAVRLVKGDFEASTLYDQDPLAAARTWVHAGADHLHVVDLDGAREGRPMNLEHVKRITRELPVPIQLGGGLRSEEAISAALAAGVDRVILGTAALAEGQLLERALREHGPQRVMVSVDARAGRVVTDGWTRSTDIGVGALLQSLIERGARELLYTNVDRDGMLEGMARDEVLTAAEAAHEGHLIYSGGISSLADLRVLASLAAPSLVGAVVGKALYEERFTVAQALAALA
jgi:phosphoribosylformimino-5-aminoimidazole carboxamide ribotide isomerase